MLKLTKHKENQIQDTHLLDFLLDVLLVVRQESHMNQELLHQYLVYLLHQ
jgi:hypothetical protein